MSFIDLLRRRSDEAPWDRQWAAREAFPKLLEEAGFPHGMEAAKAAIGSGGLALLIATWSPADLKLLDEVAALPSWELPKKPVVVHLAEFTSPAQAAVAWPLLDRVVTTPAAVRQGYLDVEIIQGLSSVHKTVMAWAVSTREAQSAETEAKHRAEQRVYLADA